MTAFQNVSSLNAIVRDFIDQAISQGKRIVDGLEHQGLAGLAQIHGPTGLGKTSTLTRMAEDGEVSVLEYARKKNLQVIFVTHRWNILQDTIANTSKRKDSKENPFTFSVIYGQEDQIKAACLPEKLSHEASGINLPDPNEEVKYLFKNGLLSTDDTKQLLLLINSLQSKNEFLRFIEKRANAQVLNVQKEEITKVCRDIERQLLSSMKNLSDQLEECEDDVEAYDSAKKRLMEFRSNALVRRALPGIVFRDNQQHLLVLSTPKLFLGFFDGNQKVRIDSAQLANYIIYFDEFDYQMEVLLKQLSQEQPIQEPPQFVGQLQAEGRSILSRMKRNIKYGRDKDGELKTLSDSLEKLLDELDEGLDELNLDLSQRRQLVVPEEILMSGKKLDSQYLFRADNLITQKPLYLQQSNNGLEVGITKPKIDGAVTSYDTKFESFLNLMEKVLRRYIMILTQYPNDDPKLVNDLNNSLFTPSNDYRDSHYSTVTKKLTINRLPRVNLSEMHSLCKTSLLHGSQTHVYGLVSWLLEQNPEASKIEQSRIKINRAYLPTTPEGLILSLASRNLVFALSATQFIPKALGNFDWDWIYAALQHVAEMRDPLIDMTSLGVDARLERAKKPVWLERPIPVIPNEAQNLMMKNVLLHLKEQKQKIRKTNVSFHHIGNVDLQNSYWQAMLESLPFDFFYIEKNSNENTAIDYRKNLLCRQIDVINTASKRPEHKGQLMYVNSTRILRKWLNDDIAQNSRCQIDTLKVVSDLIENPEILSKLEPFSETFIQLICQNQGIILCLLTADSQKKPNFTDAYQAAFQSGFPVLIMTQNASATNGINLDFLHPEIKQGMDITCQYLVEGQHFYFSHLDSTENSDPMMHAGIQIRQLDKLVRNGDFSQMQLRKYLHAIQTNNVSLIRLLNKEYKYCRDFILMISADIIQQTGRSDRVWSYVPEIEIHVDESLRIILKQFVGMTSIYHSNKWMMSDLFLQLTALIEESESGFDLLSAMLTPQQNGEDVINVLDDFLVKALNKSRTKNSKYSDTKKLKKLWDSLGQAALQSDYGWSCKRSELGLSGEGDIRLDEWATIERPSGHQFGQPLWYDPETWQFYTEPAFGRTIFYPDTLYETFKYHPALERYFNLQGYRTSLRPSNYREQDRIFHPFFVQRILQGRLGEEFIRALLRDQGIHTHTRLNHQNVLESYDFSIAKSVFRADAKHWGVEKQAEMDELFNPYLRGNALHDPMKLVEKLAHIRECEGKEIKLIIINLIANESSALLKGFSSKMKPVDPVDADILLLPGCLTKNIDEPFTVGFKQLTKMLFNLDKKL